MSKLLLPETERTSPRRVTESACTMSVLLRTVRSSILLVTVEALSTVPLVLVKLSRVGMKVSAIKSKKEKEKGSKADTYFKVFLNCLLVKRPS